MTIKCESFSDFEKKHNQKNDSHSWSGEHENLYSMLNKYNSGMQFSPELNQHIKSLIRSELKRIENNVQDNRSISDLQAKVEVISFLKYCKNTGKEFIDVIKVSNSLDLPIKQVAKILSNLEGEGLIKSE